MYTPHLVAGIHLAVVLQGKEWVDTVYDHCGGGQSIVRHYGKLP